MYLYRNSRQNNFKGHDIFRFVSVIIFDFIFHHGDTTRSGGRAVTLPVGYTLPSTGEFALLLTSQSADFQINSKR